MEDFNFENSFDSTNGNDNFLHLKFSLFRIEYNLLAIFFDSNKCLIKEDFKIISYQKEHNDTIECEIINEASLKIKNVLKSLNEKDDLFNYLSFLSSPIIQMEERTIFYFSKENTFSKLTKILSQQIFNGFILYEFEKIENPINEFYESEEFMKEVNKEIKFKVSFVSNDILNSICCLNRYMLKENICNELARENYSLKILHERMHLIIFENKLRAKNTLLKSPLIKELLLDKQKLEPESGDMLESLISVI